MQLTGVLFPDLDIALLFSLDMGAGLTQISRCLGDTNYDCKIGKNGDLKINKKRLW